VCTRICHSKSRFREKVFWHTLDSKGLSPVCTHMCHFTSLKK
jgi:hypothetical protein